MDGFVIAESRYHGSPVNLMNVRVNFFFYISKSSTIRNKVFQRLQGKEQSSSDLWKKSLMLLFLVTINQ